MITDGLSKKYRETLENSSHDPVPGQILYDEHGATEAYLAEGNLLDIIDDLNNKPSIVNVVLDFYRLRWTTTEELEDEETMRDLFGDYENSGVDTSVVYERTTDDNPDAHMYVKFERVSQLDKRDAEQDAESFLRAALGLRPSRMEN